MTSYEFLTEEQSNYGWGKTWAANGRYPMIAKRSFRTLEDAQAFIDDTSLSGTACKGLILSVFADPKASNNGIYYVEKIKTSDTDTPGVLIKAGSGTGSITAENYTAAKALATADNIGQIIYVTSDETSTTEIVPGTEGENPEYVVYTAGPYIVSGAGTVAKLGTTSAGGDIAGDVETLKGKVSGIEEDLSDLLTDVVVNEDEPVNKDYFEATTTTTDNVKVVKLKPILGNFGIDGSEAKEGLATVNSVKGYVSSELAWIEVEGE